MANSTTHQKEPFKHYLLLILQPILPPILKQQQRNLIISVTYIFKRTTTDAVRAQDCLNFESYVGKGYKNIANVLGIVEKKFSCSDYANYSQLIYSVISIMEFRKTCA